ncbi:synaptophysin-like [Pollicipes pollicipes]|uniref:synaptophysin-like n=1 Tax=Pollicipes pollicipes TaxID=41117 RepID=UPI001884B686|nr:synaptophysin-like [Pollicipes pollicipes]XP_037070640.1 synaptophysin-like [Pollicipes pollicipes]XP_037070641.1 synaptophysin-like [Pollicipes pollicipes]XP_037070642.1 synaptophysin-like [Pollicipes pollicipes]XP_037070643.1 synaptophysin-like [Pollicipes pollicipes]
MLNFDAVKEPRGFMKVLQFFFAILAFATTTSFSTHFTFHATVSACNATGGRDVVRQDVVYPFALDHVFLKQQVCNQPAVQASFHFQTDVSSDAKFFVAIGVVCMLYSMAALAGYTLFSERYAESRFLPSADFVVHGVLAVLWLAASSAWADGTGTLKAGCNPELWLNQVCATNQQISCEFAPDDFNGSFAKLHISLLIGFLNMFLWASNMWFLYKETPWFKTAQAPDSDTGNIGNI